MIFAPFEYYVAGRYLRSRKGERFISVIAVFSLVGIALGVATLIIVMSVMNGFKVDLMNRILGLNGDISVYAQGSMIRDYDALTQKIRKVQGVVNAFPMVEGQVLMTVGQYSVGGIVKGISPSDLVQFKAISGSIVAGTLDDYHGHDVIIIGTTLAQRAGLNVGSQLTLLSPNGATTAFGTVPRLKSYRVVAVFDAGIHDYNANCVFLPLSEAQIYFQLQQSVTQIQVNTSDATNVRPITHRISSLVQDNSLRIMDWTQSNNAFFGAVQVEQNVMFLILTLIILVAAFNVISSLIMMVKDKARDIAILRTFGASRYSIMKIFLLCGMSVGTIGTIVGTIIGVVFCLNIESIRQVLQKLTGTNLFNPEVYYLEHLPSKLALGQVIEVVVMALLLSFLATLYPSWKAAKMDPVKVLRHE